MYAVGQVSRTSAASGTFHSSKSTSLGGTFQSSKSISPCSTLGEDWDAAAAHTSELQPPSEDATAHWSSAATFRSILLGTIAAAVNGSLDMYSLFRSGGLGAYWALIVGYYALNLLDRLPTSNALWRLLHPPAGTNQQEHGIIVLMASAGALSQALGLTSGIQTLQQELGEFERYQRWDFLIPWVTVASGFGTSLAIIYYRSLVLSNKYQWPQALLLAQTIKAFHRDESTAAVTSPDSPSSTPVLPTESSASLRSMGGWWWDTKVMFVLVALAAFVYESSLQVWFYWASYLPLLCWVCTTRSCGDTRASTGGGAMTGAAGVLGSGYSGTNIGGFGIDFPGAMAYLPNILPAAVLVQMFVGCAMLTWVFGPLYLADVVSWPGAFGVFNEHGDPWQKGQKIFLSGGTWSMMSMLLLLVVGSLYEGILSQIPYFKQLEETDRVYEEAEAAGLQVQQDSSAPEERHSAILLSQHTLGDAEQPDNTPVATAIPIGQPATELDPDDQIPMYYGVVLVLLFATALVTLVQAKDMGINIWFTLAAAAIGVSVSYGLAIVQARTGNNMAMPAGALTQLIFGSLSSSIATNAVGSAVTVMSGSQCITTLNGLRMGLLLGLKPRLVFAVQMYATLVGALAEAVIYRDIMDRAFGCCAAKQLPAVVGGRLPQTGCGCQVVFGEDGWVNIGGEAVATMALVFTNLHQAVQDNPAFLVWVLATAAVVVIWTPLRRCIPRKTRKYTPDLVLWGLGAAAPQNIWYLFAVFVLYKGWKWLEFNYKSWYDHTNFFITSAVIMGSGFSGFVVLAWPGNHIVSLGNVFQDGCNVPPNMQGI